MDEIRKNIQTMFRMDEIRKNRYKFLRTPSPNPPRSKFCPTPVKTEKYRHENETRLRIIIN